MTIEKINMDVLSSSIARIIYCYSYHRISTKRQIKGGGIRRQQEASEAICEEMGWIMDTSFHLTDIGKSAYSGKNLDDTAALGGFLNAVDAGLIKRPAVLLVESLDRLSRANIMDALELFIRIMNAGITIFTSIDRMSYNKDEMQHNFSPLLISITLMQRSFEESETKSKRIKKSWRQMEDNLRQGKLGTSNIYPFWIDISSGEPKVIKDRARIVKDVFSLCIKDNLSLVDIANAINKKYGEAYYATNSKVHELLNNKKVLGLYMAKDGEEIEAFPAVIEKETFYLAKTMLRKRRFEKTGRPGKRAINFFRNMLKCGVCGRTINACGRGSGNNYLCSSSRLKQRCDQSSSLGVMKFQTVLLYALSLVSKGKRIQNPRPTTLISTAKS